MPANARHLAIPNDDHMGFGTDSALCFGSRPPWRTKRVRVSRNLSEVTCKRCMHLISAVIAARAHVPARPIPTTNPGAVAPAKEE
jgi:hypothetical protein